MEIPQPEKLQLPRFNGMLLRMFGVPKEVESSFQLLSPQDQQLEDGLYEFSTENTNVHVVMLDGHGNIARDHHALSEKGVKVFPDIHVGDTSFLVVPEGARSIKSLLSIVARDVASYGVVFEQVGQVLQQLDRAQHGIPSYGSVLARFAWAPDEVEPSGGGVFVVPPYGLVSDMTTDAMVSNIGEELAQSDFFDPTEQARLIGKVNHGRQRIG